MSFFESLLALVLAAIILSQISRRISVPYASTLAAAGLVIALLPGTPSIALDPKIALVLFIAPVLVDAAFDFPLSAIRRLWRPLLFLAVFAVLATTAAVAFIGYHVAGLPIAAAIALGAIVAPPDAAAASAVLSRAHLPRRTVEVLKGESLLNDGTALLVFGAATAIQARGDVDGYLVAQLGFAAPGGIALGIVLAWGFRRIVGFAAGTLGGNLLEFVTAFTIWLIAERLHVSAVLCVVAFAMTIARTAGTTQHARVRIHSFAVWSSVVFLLNVLAFLLMGMQARSIIGAMPPSRLAEAGVFAVLVVVTIILVRMLIVVAYNRISVWRSPPDRRGEQPTLRQATLVGWCGMRGLVTLATAFALPAGFPQRDLILLTAFAVVLATLVIQGLSLNPLIRLLRLESSGESERELSAARLELARAALAALDGKQGAMADAVRQRYALLKKAAGDEGQAERVEAWHALELKAVRAQRARLDELRDDGTVGGDAYGILQEEIDWRELALEAADKQVMEES